MKAILAIVLLAFTFNVSGCEETHKAAAPAKKEVKKEVKKVVPKKEEVLPYKKPTRKIKDKK